MPCHVGVLLHTPPESLRGEGLAAEPVALLTPRKTRPLEISAEDAHWSMAAFTQPGIGMLPTRPCLPRRSTITQRPSRCRTSWKCRLATSSRRNPQTIMTASDPSPSRLQHACRTGKRRETITVLVIGIGDPSISGAFTATRLAAHSIAAIIDALPASEQKLNRGGAN